MEKFDRVTSPAALLTEDNLDTDIIFPARFLLITARKGLGRYAFHDRRYAADGRERPDFTLNRPQFRNTSILIAGANFGSGSSREQAVWALLGFGIRCIIAPSFGEIFYANCFRNGVLPIILAPAQMAALITQAEAGKPLTVDLVDTTVSAEDGFCIAFNVDEQQRLSLLNGWDETGLIINAQKSAIAGFEHAHRVTQPWLFGLETVQ